MDQISDFFRKLFESSDWPPRWHCGNWTGFHGWLYIVSDLLIWSAYFTIPIVIIKFITKKHGVRFIRLYFLFAAFILACGATHFLDALAFWIPMYRLNALVKFITGALSWITVFYLVKYSPVLFNLRSHSELEVEIVQRGKAEKEILKLNETLEQRISERTAALTASFKEVSDYKLALDESSIVAITNQKGIIKYVNDNFCKISKYSREELIGKDHRIINSGFHPKEFIKELWITVANGKIWKGELKNRAKDGSDYWVDTTIVPFLDDNDKPYQYLAIRADITSRKLSEEHLFNSIKETSDYKYALDESSIVAITDQKGVIQYVNDNFCEISKYSREDLIGKDHRIINSGHHTEKFIRDLWSTIANGKIWKGELKNKAKDGTMYWVDTTIVPFLNERGKPYQYIAIRSDITEKKKVELLVTENKTLVSESVKKERQAVELAMANKQLAFQTAEIEIRAAALIVANKELAFQSDEKERRAEELAIANKELTFQNSEKEKRAAELLIANQELAFQSVEKEKRAAELGIANEELNFQNSEKENRVSELLIANKELLFQNDEKRKRTAELSETLERVSFLASIADNIQDPIISTSNDINKIYTITRWNKPAEELLEWKSEEVIGRNAIDILKAEFVFETREQITSSLDKHGVWQGEVIYHTKSGGMVYGLSTMSKLKNASGAVIGNLLLIRDISKRKKMEDALTMLNEELEQKVIDRTEKLAASEMHFRALIENSAEGIALTDRFSNILYRSPSSAKITGILPEENTIGLTHPEDMELIKTKYAQVLQQPGVPIPFEGRFLNGSGNYFWLEGTLTNLIHVEAVKAIVVNYRDITKRKEVEMKLIKSEKIYKTIASSIPGSVICLLDSEFRYLLIEGDMIEKLGFLKKDLLGNKAEDVLPESVFAGFREQFKKVFDGETITDEAHLSGYDIIIRFIPLKDEREQVYAMMTVAIDVTLLKNAQRDIVKLNLGLEEKIIQRTRELKSSNEELESFSYSVSHDLRAPLRAINGYTKMLLENYESRLTQEAVRLMSNIARNAAKMGQLIDDLLNFSRIGRKELIKTNIQLKQMVTAICIELKAAHPDRSIDIIIGTLDNVMADKITLQNVWINLISNAIKYTGGKEEAIIEIGSELIEDDIVYHIEDNGAGFDMRYADKLFGVFQRLHSDEEFEGTGVGLALVQRIVIKHGGLVWAESEVNKGAIFYFTLTKSVKNE